MVDLIIEKAASYKVYVLINEEIVKGCPVVIKVKQSQEEQTKLQEKEKEKQVIINPFLKVFFLA